MSAQPQPQPQPQSQSQSGGTPSGGTPSATQAPITQEKAGFRHNFPEWMKQLPRGRFPEQNPNFTLLDPATLEKMLKSLDAEAAQRIREDMAYLDKELLRLFKDRDYDAKFQQNRYRQYQIGYMVLAAAATIVGAFLALSLDSSPELVPVFGFIETLIALLTTYLATISGRESPLPLWLENRRKAEHLRREYFRYLMDLAPYDELTGYDRRRTLSIRAADINRGFFPEANNGQRT